MQSVVAPTLPPTGFLRLPQIIGTKSKKLTEEGKKAKEEKAKRAEEEKAKKTKKPRVRKTEPVIYPPLVPVCASTWWDGVKSGRYPKPLKLSPRVTVWRVEDIRALIESAQEVAA